MSNALIAPCLSSDVGRTILFDNELGANTFKIQAVGHLVLRRSSISYIPGIRQYGSARPVEHG